MTKAIEPIFLTTTMLAMLYKGKERHSATGFFFKGNKNIFLVTNKHVIYGKNYSDPYAQPIVDSIKTMLHIDLSDLSRNEETELPLYKNGMPVWLEHKQKEIDVVCIPLNLDSKFLVVPVSEELLNSEGIVVGFEKIFVMGYPYAWYDDYYNLPITRIGHLSSPFGVPFRNNPFLIGDVETHPGMSGSPVLIHLKDYVTTDENGRRVTHLGSSRLILAGIFSGQPEWRINDKATGRPIDIPHSLSVIWFANLIQQILG